MIDGLIVDSVAIHDLFCSMICMLLFLTCALISLLDSALKIVAQVRICSYSGLAIRMF